MLVLIDNYDSFTYNLVHFLGELGAETVVHRNDTLSAADVVAQNPSGVVISPGPCNPDKAGISLDIVAAAEEHRFPLLGVCLGHQSLGQHFGGKVVQAPSIMHGKVGAIRHSGQGVFEGLPSPLRATRYHSLVVERASLPDCLEVTAETEDDVIMGLQHRELPIHGVQFHPESIATEHGHALLRNFLTLTETPWRSSKAA
jgi:anthranilate synthase component 2